MTEISQGKAPRRTKIIATLGPATDDEATIRALIRAGVDALRLNFSHGNSEDHVERARRAREISGELRYHVGIIGDLQGPKIRIARFVEGSVELEQGRTFALVPGLGPDEGTSECVGLTYPELYKDVKSGDVLLLDDGRIELEVVSSNAEAVVTRILHGGVVAGSKGVNRRGGGLSAPSITQKDHEDIKLAARIGVDYLAVSFPSNAQDIIYAGKLLREADCDAHLIAKIERAEALDAIEEITQASEGIMVARGDLNVEIGDAALIAVQKRLIRLAREHNKIAITATEMMQSMIENPRPTRAEISDVANAVLDGTDAVMLSGETAIGKHPIAAVQTMGRICRGAEQGDKRSFAVRENARHTFDRIDEVIAMSAIHAGSIMEVAAIAALTESGSSALWMSRVRSSIPIYALTPHVKTCRKVTLYRGVYPGEFESRSEIHTEVNSEIIAALARCGTVEKGDLVIITKGDMMGVHGGTNTLKIVEVNNL